MITKAYKFRIYPNKSQIEYFNNSVRTTHFIYNICLRQQIDINNKMNELGIIDKNERKKYMTDNDLWFNRFKMSKTLTKMGNDEKYLFLKKIDATTKTYTLKRIENAFKNIKKTGAGFPKFKNRNSSYSFTGQIQYKNNKPYTFNLLLKNKKFAHINIPKVKKIKISCHIQFFIDNWNNPNILKINSYTISKSGNCYFISFQAEVNDPNIKPVFIKKEIKPETSIGIDFGIKRPITTSNKIDFDNELFSKQFNLIKDNKNKLKKFSSILNRKRDYHKKNKSEKNFYEFSSYKRIKKQLNKQHFKITSKRENLQHNITKVLIDNENVDTYILEDLELKNMIKRNVNGKLIKNSNLNRALNDVGLGSIAEKLTYKAKQIGKNVVKVNPKFTSQKCSNCGHISKFNRKTQSIFKCQKCGFTLNADFNAAINIKNDYFIKNK